MFVWWVSIYSVCLSLLGLYGRVSVLEDCLVDKCFLSSVHVYMNIYINSCLLNYSRASAAELWVNYPFVTLTLIVDHQTDHCQTCLFRKKEAKYFLLCLLWSLSNMLSPFCAQLLIPLYVFISECRTLYWKLITMSENHVWVIKKKSNFVFKL